MSEDTSGAERPGAVRREAQDHRRTGAQPLAGCAVTASTHAVLVAAGVLLARGSAARGTAASVGPWDLALATHKLSRLVVKDPVTSPSRAFLTRFQGVSAPAEPAEEARHVGGRRAAHLPFL